MNMKKLIALLALFPLAAMAGTANLTWTAPTLNTDGTAITAPLSYKVYGGVQGSAKAVLATVSALAYTHSTAPNGVTYCYQVSAVAGGVESALSAEGCKVMPPAVPNPPTNLAITVAVVAGINMAPVYKLTSTGKRSLDPAGFIALNEACSGNVLFTYRGFSWRAVDAAKVQWFGVVPDANIAGPCKPSA